MLCILVNRLLLTHGLKFWEKSGMAIPPVCEANNDEEVANWLLRLEENKLQMDISRRSAVFAETNLGHELVINCLEKIPR